MELQLLCNNIRKLRLKNGLSQKQMAKHLHIGTESLRKMERGEIPPRMGVNLIFYTCKYFGVTIRQLFSENLQDSKENKENC